MGKNIKKGVIWRKIEGKIFIIDPEREKLHSLNETASFFWELLADKKTAEEMTEKAASRYEAAPEEIRKDLSALLELLKKEKLLI